MNLLRKVWAWWQFEALRMQFPDWDIVRTERDVWSVSRPPVNRVIVGCIDTVRDEMDWFDKLFANGVVLRDRRRNGGADGGGSPGRAEVGELMRTERGEM